MSDISVFGAGAFGTALAISLARQGRNVTLIARSTSHADAMNAEKQNTARLSGFSFPSSLRATANAAHISPICLMTVPTQALATAVRANSPSLAGCAVVACCKGVDLATGLGPTAVIDRECPQATSAILSGPSFAVDIAAGLPTALTLAAHSEATAAMLQHALSTSNLRLYRSADIVGVEFGGALKNVVAIAAGVTIGAGLGESARAALMTRGYDEMKRFACCYGAELDTLSGLSGLGDLVLTCTSTKSRNFAHGVALGRGDPVDASATVEGVTTARAVAALARERGLDMPITTAVAALLANEITIAEAIKSLLSRPLKKE